MTFRIVLAIAVLSVGTVAAMSRSRQDRSRATGEPGMTILAYHRFGPTATDAMTVRTATFRSELDYLRQHDVPVIPLRALVSYLRGQGPPPPPRAIVLTADDGHESVFTDMLPLVREYQVPVTLFIYPSAISNASYAMTWAQLEELHRTGLFDIQSHTYWHPNFATEKRRLSPAAYQAFATTQLVKPITVLKDTLGVDVNMVAWPFGIYDDELTRLAADAGYVAGFTLDRHLVTRRDPVMALPRFLVTDKDSGANFASLLPPEEQ